MVNKKMILSAMLIAVIGLMSVGCSDDPVNPTNIDEAPMIPPTKLIVELENGKTWLEWGPSVDNRVVNYFVDRENSNGRVSPGKTGRSKTQIVDENPVIGTSTYYVNAAGAGSRKSSAASISLTIVRSHETGRSFRQPAGAPRFGRRFRVPRSYESND